MERVTTGSDVRAGAYLRAHARQALIVLAVAVLAAVSAFVVSSMQTKTYEATARLIYGGLVDPAAQDVPVVYPPNQLERQLKNVANAVANDAIEADIRKGVSLQIPQHAPYTVTATAVIQPTTTISWTEVTARSSDPKVARVAANVAAATLLESRRKSALTQDKKALKTVNREMKGIQDLYQRHKPTSSSIWTADWSKKSRLTIQINALSAAKWVTASKPAPTGDSWPITLPRNYMIAAVYLPFRPLSWAKQSEQVAPRPLRTAFLAFVAALVAGSGIVFLLSQRDVRLTDAAAIQGVLGLPLLGQVEWSAIGSGDPASFSSAVRGTSLRSLRTNVEFLLADREVRSVGVVGYSRTNGASLLACNLAAATALSGKRVVLVDGDLRGGLVAHCFALENDRGVTNVVADHVASSDAAHVVDLQGEEGKGSDAGEVDDARMTVLLNGPERADPRLVAASHRFASLIGQLKQEYDAVIVTTPALTEGEEARAVIAALDSLICVVDTSDSRKSTLHFFRSRMMETGRDVLGAVVLTGKASVGRRGVTTTRADAMTIPSEEPVLGE